jgi:hypothetical protein
MIVDGANNEVCRCRLQVYRPSRWPADPLTNSTPLVTSNLDNNPFYDRSNKAAYRYLNTKTVANEAATVDW